MSDEQKKEATDRPLKRTYTRPRLVEYGSVESLTAGSRTIQMDNAGGGFRREG